jgi:outer membrane cobalamin receptor
LRRHLARIYFIVVLALLLVATRAPAQSSVEVTVNGDRALGPSASSRDVNAASSVVRRDRLSAPGVEAGDVLRGLPGVQVRQSGGLAAPSTLGLRGANPNQTAAVIAGARLDDELTGVTDLSLFPLWFANKIEVFRGTSPFGFDRILPGGVLVLEPRNDSQTGGALRAETGSFGERAVHAIGAGGDESFSVTAGVRVAAADNDYPFVNHEGMLLSGQPGLGDRRRNADFSSRDVWLSTARSTLRYTLEAVVNRFDREQGVTTTGLLQPKEPRAITARDLWATRGTLSIDRYLELEGHFNVLASSLSLRDPRHELALQARRVEVDTLRSESGLAVQNKPNASGRWRVSLAAEAARLTRVDAPDAARAPPDVVATRQAWRGAGAFEARLAGALGVHAQAMGELASEHSHAASDRRYLTQATGRAGLHWHEASWQSWFNLTRAARPPALGERYGMSVTVVGNPRLKPERSLGAEVGARIAPGGRLARVWLEAVSFARYTTDAIVVVRTSQNHATLVNFDATRVLGLEFAGGARLFAPFEFEGNLTLLDPRQTLPVTGDHPQLMPFQSQQTMGTALRMRQPLPTRHLRTLLVEARYNWESSRAAAVTFLPAQSSFDLELALLSLLQYTDLRVRVANLFNAPRYDFIGYPLPGRSIHSSLEVKW